MLEIKPIWTSASFLVYTGGLTVLLSAIAALVYLSLLYGSAAETGWALLILVVLYLIAHAFRLRGRPLAAGIFAFASVIAWGAFVVLLFEWFGWHGVTGSLSDWSWSRLAFWLLVLAAALDDQRRFRFPLIRLISAVVLWLFVIDLITAGGTFTWVVTLVVGLVYLAVASLQEEPSAFWLHLVAGLLIGSTLYHWLHAGGDVGWAFLGVFAALFIGLGARLQRSSWAVIGTLGLFVLAGHYATVWTGTPRLAGPLSGASPFGSASPLNPGTQYFDLGFAGLRPWAPIVTFAGLGFLLVVFGLLARRQSTRVAASPPE